MQISSYFPQIHWQTQQIPSCISSTATAQPQLLHIHFPQLPTLQTVPPGKQLSSMSNATSKGPKSLQFTTAKTCRLPQSLHWTKRPSWPQVHAVYNCLHASASLSKPGWPGWPGGLDGLDGLDGLKPPSAAPPTHTTHILMHLIAHGTYSAPIFPELAEP